VLTRLPCINARVWHDSPSIFKQIPRIGKSYSNLLYQKGIHSIPELLSTDPRRIELVLGRHSPFGNQVIEESGKSLPVLDLRVVEEVSGLIAEYGASTSCWINLLVLAYSNHYHSDNDGTTKSHNGIVVDYLHIHLTASHPCKFTVKIDWNLIKKVSISLMSEQFSGININKIIEKALDGVNCGDGREEMSRCNNVVMERFKEQREHQEPRESNGSTEPNMAITPKIHGIELVNPTKNSCRHTCKSKQLYAKPFLLMY